MPTITGGSLLSHHTKMAGSSEVWDLRNSAAKLGGLIGKVEPATDAGQHRNDGGILRVRVVNPTIAATTSNFFGPAPQVDFVDETKDQTTGKILGYFVDDYYNRIHVIPDDIDVGDIEEEDIKKDFTVVVWNAYFVTKHLAEVSELRTIGISLFRPDDKLTEPVDYAALQERSYDIEVLWQGPTIVDAYYTFQFPMEPKPVWIHGTRVPRSEDDGDLEDFPGKVDGRTRRLIPFLPDWSKHITERFEWLTEVQRSYNGRELRSKLRVFPRRSFRYDCTINKKDFRILDGLLNAWQFKTFFVPVWTQEQALTTAAVAGGTEISVATGGMELVEGDFIVISASSMVRSYDVVEVGVVTPTTIEIPGTISQAWGQDATVMPLRVCKMQNSVTTKLLTLEAVSVSFTFEVYTPRHHPVGAEQHQYNGLPILDDKQNYFSGIANQYTATWETYDNQVSRKYHQLSTEIVEKTTDFLWVFRGAAIQKFTRRIHAWAGRQKAMWVPTYNRDIQALGVSQFGQTFLKIQHMGYTEFLLDQTKKHRTHLRIEFPSGLVDYFEVVASQEAGVTVSELHEVLELDRALPEVLDESKCPKISYMLLSRKYSDAVEYDWVTPDVIRCHQKFRSVPDELY